MLVAVGAPPLVTQPAIVIPGGPIIGDLCPADWARSDLGYLAVGVLTGPHALGLVDETNLVDLAAERATVALWAGCS